MIRGLFYKIQEFVASTLVTEEDSAEGRCRSDRICLLDSSKGHACMRCLDYHGNSKRLEGVLDTVTDLSSESFLHLEATGECLDYACDLAQASNRAVRDICNMSLADERHDMMFTCGIQFNVLHKDHLLIFLLEHGAAKYLRAILIHAVRKELKRLCNSLWSLYKSLSFRIFA